MASGTKGNVELAKLKRKVELMQARQKAESLAKNREEIIKAVCNAFGWEKLEPFAEDMLNQSLAGGLVDVQKLIADLAEWQKTQNNLESTEE